jgi:hypothetical protein
VATDPLSDPLLGYILLRPVYPKTVCKLIIFMTPYILTNSYFTNQQLFNNRRIEHSNASANTNGLYIRVQRLLGHADLRMATRYVQDVSAQTDRVIENSRKYVI